MNKTLIFLIALIAIILLSQYTPSSSYEAKNYMSITLPIYKFDTSIKISDSTIVEYPNTTIDSER